MGLSRAAPFAAGSVIAGVIAGACAVDFPDYPVGHAVGAPCATDEDCLGGFCWATGSTLTSDGSPPEGGFCTADCSGSTVCPEGTVCHGFSGAFVCLERCTFGDGNADKCRGRRNVGCTVTDDKCLPVCSSDSECGSLVCNRATKLCAESRGMAPIVPCVVGGAACAAGLRCVTGPDDVADIGDVSFCGGGDGP